MAYRLSHGTVRDTPRHPIHVVRVHGKILELTEIDGIAERMRERLAHRGELAADVVVVQGNTQNTLRLFGSSYSVSRVRAAMFNAAVSWTPIELN